MHDAFGLEGRVLDRLVAVFRTFPAIETVILYGSRAKGTFRDGSDIDITLTGASLGLRETVFPLSDQLDELNLPYTFDISIYEQIDNPDLKGHIQRVGRVIYRAGSTAYADVPGRGIRS